MKTSTSRPIGTTSSPAPSNRWDPSIDELRACFVSLEELCDRVTSQLSAASSPRSPAKSSMLQQSVVRFLNRKEAA